MVASMTAFARLEDSGEWGHAVWEIRTVNHRYLDISIRLPEELRALETSVREQVSIKLKRGKVECNLRYDADSATGDISINAELAQRIIHAARELQHTEPPGDKSPLTYYAGPASLTKKHRTWSGSDNALMITLLDKALDNIVADNRRREGEKIEQMIAETLRSFTAPGPANPKQKFRKLLPPPGNGTWPGYRNSISNRTAAGSSRKLPSCHRKLDVAEELDRHGNPHE